MEKINLTSDAIYKEIMSISHKEFLTQMSSFDKSKATISDSEDKRKIEKILSLREGILSSDEFYLSKIDCTSCGRTLTFYDSVFTALDSNHPASLIIYTLLGDKYFVQPPPKAIKCSDCQTIIQPDKRIPIEYESRRYGCCGG